MKSVVTFLVFGAGLVLFYFTVIAAADVFYADWDLPEPADQTENTLRVAFITTELDHSFWDDVAEGAEKQAAQSGIELDINGIYGSNTDDFLREIEVAIYAKVDGIIVQGLDNEKFKELTKSKAASYGIPVITIAHDVPKEESLRKTYVGSDQVASGTLLAQQLVKDMGASGEVILLSNSDPEYFQAQRLEGITRFLADYPSISIVETSIGSSSEQDLTSIPDLLNHYPKADAFIAVNATFTEELVTEIETRRQVEPLFIYTLDEERDAYNLLEQGKIDGVVEQSPEEMGRLSVELMSSWLTDSTPLEIDGYLTDIRMMEAMEP